MRSVEKVLERAVMAANVRALKNHQGNERQAGHAGTRGRRAGSQARHADAPQRQQERSDVHVRLRSSAHARTILKRAWCKAGIARYSTQNMGQCSSAFEWSICCPKQHSSVAAAAAPATLELHAEVAQLRAQLNDIAKHLQTTDRQLTDLMDELTHACHAHTARPAHTANSEHARIVATDNTTALNTAARVSEGAD
jgi:hypothetical protein